MEFKINPLVTKKFPELFVHLTIVRGFKNQTDASSAQRILDELRQAENEVRSEFPGKEQLQAHPFVTKSCCTC